MNSHPLLTTVRRGAAPRRRLALEPAGPNRGLRSAAGRTAQSAQRWRSQRMIERLAARPAAQRGAPATDGPVSSVAVEPLLLRLAGRTPLLNARHIVPAADTPSGRRDGMAWIV